VGLSGETFLINSHCPHKRLNRQKKGNSAKETVLIYRQQAGLILDRSRARDTSQILESWIFSHLASFFCCGDEQPKDQMDIYSNIVAYICHKAKFKRFYYVLPHWYW
jgi:hypothetical protein